MDKVSTLQNIVPHNGPITSVSVGPRTGMVFATGGDDKMLNLWSLGKQSPCASYGPFPSFVSSTRFDNTEEIIICGNNGGAVLVFDLSASKMTSSWSAHRSIVNNIVIDPSNNQNIASCGHDGMVKVFNPKSRQPIATFTHGSCSVNCLAYSSDGKYLSSCGDDGIVKVFDLVAGGLLSYFECHTGPAKFVEFHHSENI